MSHLSRVNSLYLFCCSDYHQITILFIFLLLKYYIIVVAWLVAYLFLPLFIFLLVKGGGSVLEGPLSVACIPHDLGTILLSGMEGTKPKKKT